MVIERLTARHAQDGFDCGEQSLNELLLRLVRRSAALPIGPASRVTI